MNIHLINAASGVIHAAQERGTQTAAGLAYALESAQLLQSPESAAELDRLRADRREDAAQFEEYRSVVAKLRARVAELEALKPALYQTCATCGAEYRFGHPCIACQFKALMAVEAAVRPCGCPARFERHAWGCLGFPVEDPHDSLHPFEPVHQGVSDAKRRLPQCKQCGKPASDPAHAEDASPQVQRLRALLAGQRAAVEDPHDSELHHPYRLGRDLPEARRG